MTAVLNKFLSLDSAGTATENVAVTTSTANAIPTLDGSGLLNMNMMPSGAGPAFVTAVADAAGVAAGDMVYLTDVAGALTASKAQANALATLACGYVLDAAAVGVSVKVYLSGINTLAAHGVAGENIWLSTSTPGAVVNALPTGSGNYIQQVGLGVGVSTALKVILNIQPTIAIP